MAGWPGRKPLSRAENAPVAFIRELKKQVRVSLVPRGEGQSAIPGRADVAHRISYLNGTGTMIWFRRACLTALP